MVLFYRILCHLCILLGDSCYYEEIMQHTHFACEPMLMHSSFQMLAAVTDEFVLFGLMAYCLSTAFHCPSWFITSPTVQTPMLHNITVKVTVTVINVLFSFFSSLTSECHFNKNQNQCLIFQMSANCFRNSFAMWYYSWQRLHILPLSETPKPVLY